MKNSELKKKKVLFKNYLKIKDKRGCLKKGLQQRQIFSKAVIEIWQWEIRLQQLEKTKDVNQLVLNHQIVELIANQQKTLIEVVVQNEKDNVLMIC